MGQCTEFKAVPGYGLSCKVSGIEELIKPKPVTDKNKKNLSVNICGAVIDESSDIHTTSVISGNDNGEVIVELGSQQKLSVVDNNSQIFPISLRLTRDSKKSPKSKSPPPPFHIHCNVYPETCHPGSSFHKKLAEKTFPPRYKKLRNAPKIAFLCGQNVKTKRNP